MLEGFSTVLVAFFVFCLYRQDLIRNKTYYYATFGCLLLIIFFNVFFYLMSTASGQGIFAILLGIFHALAFILTMGYVGGVGVTQLGQEIAQAVRELQPESQTNDSSASSSEAKLPAQSGPLSPQPGPAEPVRDRPRVVIELPKKE